MLFIGSLLNLEVYLFNCRTKKALGECKDEVTRLRNVCASLESIFVSVHVDNAGHIISINDKFTEELGYTIEDLSGVEISRIQVHPQTLFAPNVQFGGAQEYIDSKDQIVTLNIGWVDMSDGSFLGYGCAFPSLAREDVENIKIFNELNSSVVVMQFNLAGEIMHVNKRFTQAMGYSISEVKGQHHKVFCQNESLASPQYKEFWNSLSKGVTTSARIRRITKAGRILWLEAIYSPIRDRCGKVYKIVKYASAVTERVENADRVKQAVSFAYDISLENDAKASQGVSLAGDSLIVRRSIVQQMNSLISSTRDLKSQSLLLESTASTIGAIAAQADLLRVNVAIEAGRAGAHKSGLGVIAEEIQNLAVRTSVVTKEIDSLIRKNNDLVSKANIQAQCGVDQADMLLKLAEHADDAMAGVKSGSKQILLAMESISSRMNSSV